jgi:FAD-dependent urate hydroxylase
LDQKITIVGAGPYGLSIAAHLRKRAARFELLGTLLESWRYHMPRGMLLKSERFASNLWDPERRYTLRRYFEAQKVPYQPIGHPLSLEQFLEYAEWFRQHTAVEPRDVKVTELRRAPGGFRLTLADGSAFTSRSTVLATGQMAFRRLPPELAAVSEPLVMHSTRIGDVRSYCGRDVCVIGGGQSALETAALMHESGAHVRLLVREDHLEWNAPSKPRSSIRRLLEPDAGVASGWRSWGISELPRVFRWCFAPEWRHWFVAHSYGPSGSWWLRARCEGHVEMLLRSRVLSAEPAGQRVRLRVETPQGVQIIETQHVVAATGFKIDIDRLDYLEPSLSRAITREARGIPALDSRFETSVPGLFIVGAASAPVFGPIMRFMYGAKHVAPLLTDRLRRGLRRTPV